MDTKLYNNLSVKMRVLANAKLRELYDPEKSSDLARAWSPFTARWYMSDGDVVFQLELRDDPRSREIRNEPWAQDIAHTAIKDIMAKNIDKLIYAKMTNA